MQETEIDPVHIVYKVQKMLNELMESNAQVLLGGGVDNMEKYCKQEKPNALDEFWTFLVYNIPPIVFFLLCDRHTCLVLASSFLPLSNRFFI